MQEPKSDMEAIFEMVENESAIQDTMDQAALILSSGEHMNDKQEERVIMESNLPKDDQMPPLEMVGAVERRLKVFSAPQDAYQGQLDAIRTETMRTKEERAARILAGYILEIEELATDCDFELTVNLAELTRVQLVNILDALRTLRMEQTKR